MLKEVAPSKHAGEQLNPPATSVFVAASTRTKSVIAISELGCGVGEGVKATVVGSKVGWGVGSGEGQGVGSGVGSGVGRLVGTGVGCLVGVEVGDIVG